MRHIPFATPPAEFVAWVSAHPNASWDEFRDAQQGILYNRTRDSLTGHQRGLCAFCEINLIESDREIDHWHPQSDTAGPTNWALNFDNLQACCLGGTSQGHLTTEMTAGNRYLEPVRENLSCGAKKGELCPEGVIYRPSDLPRQRSVFFVDFEGRMHADNQVCMAHRLSQQTAMQTIQELGLDCARLRRSRAAWWDEVSKSILSLHHEYTREEIARRFLSADAAGRLPKFFTTLRSMFGRAADPIVAVGQ
jgi:uncharacterized protein (TIGR02646 family)